MDRLCSKLGGPIHWPADLPWPVCQEHEEAYVPVLQIHARDAGRIAFPDGKSLLQILWCPRDHVWGGYIPLVDVRWHAAESAPRLEALPRPAEPSEDYMPNDCSLTLTSTVELPALDSLEKDLRKEVSRWLKSRKLDSDDYLEELGPSMQSKLGGHPHWIQDTPQFSVGRKWLMSPHCARGHEMPLLATLATGDGKIYQVGGLSVGRMGNLYVFSCPHCADAPFEVIEQN